MKKFEDTCSSLLTKGNLHTNTLGNNTNEYNSKENNKSDYNKERSKSKERKNKKNNSIDFNNKNNSIDKTRHTYYSPIRIQTKEYAEKYSPLQPKLESSVQNQNHNKSKHVYREQSPLHVKTECQIHNEKYYYN